MDYLILALGLVLTSLCEYLMASLGSMSGSVVTALADEGSTVGIRLKHVLDDSEEARLSVSLLDVVLLVVATVAATSIAHTYGFSNRVTIDIAIFTIGVVLAKTLAAVVGTRYADQMLRGTAVMFSVTQTLARPLVLIHRILMRLTHRDSPEDEAREELEALVETARDEGALDPGEYRIMTNIMRLSSIEVSDVMTPRLVVFSMPETATIAEAIRQPELQQYSRFPVHENGSLDSVNGYVMAKDVLRAALAGRHTVELSKLKRDVHFVPENVALDQALEQFLQKRQHLFMVVDEYGGVEGLLSMEDVMETMLGAEIVDEADHVVDLRQLAKLRRDARIAERRKDSE
jgi:CBS domain containing-hemolysin-like protein